MNACTEPATPAACFETHHVDNQPPLFEPRDFWQDDAVWLPEIDATQKGLTLRRLMCEAIESALSGESAPKDALRLVQTTLDAM